MAGGCAPTFELKYGHYADWQQEVRGWLLTAHKNDSFF